MPKVNGEILMDVTVADIQAQIDKIAYLLDGKIDDDNIYDSGIIAAKIQPKTIVNMADETRPVDGFKIFGGLPGKKDFQTDILTPLLTEKYALIQPIVLTGSCAFVFNNSTMEREVEEIDKDDRSFLEKAGDAGKEFINDATLGIIDLDSPAIFQPSKIRTPW